MGVLCADCRAVLEPARCTCGQTHGYGYQERNDWARATWPEHDVRHCPIGG